MSAIWHRLKHVPGIQPLVYRWVKRHVHEAAFAALRAGNPDVMQVREGLVDRLAGLIASTGVKKVLNYPCSHLAGLDLRLVEHGIDCINADMVRGQGRHLNLLYDCIPRVDLIMMRNFLDHVDTGDARLILERIRQAGVRHILMTDYPCLNANWNNVPGEWRPVNLARPPYDLGEPEDVIPDPDPARRPDRQLALWRIASK